MNFELTEVEVKQVNEWAAAIDARVLKEQRKTLQNFNLLTQGGKYPYYGAVSANIQYIFTPTSIGTLIRVRHLYTDEVLDLSFDW